MVVPRHNPSYRHHHHNHRSMKMDQSKAPLQPPRQSPPHHSDRPPFSTLSLPKQGSAVSISALSQALPHRLSGSSTDLNVLSVDSSSITSDSSSSGSSVPFVGETIANSSAPAKRIVFSLKTPEEKADWLGTLIAIQRKRWIFYSFVVYSRKLTFSLIFRSPFLISAFFSGICENYQNRRYP